MSRFQGATKAFLLASLASAAVSAPTNTVAEKLWLKGIEFPHAYEAKIAHYFTVFQHMKPTVEWEGPVAVNRRVGTKENGLQVSLVHSDDWMRMDKTHFCCSQTDVDTGVCDRSNLNKLMITEKVKATTPALAKVKRTMSYSWRLVVKKPMSGP